ncbi:MAG: alternative ribosome rescue aminoacyl-tRNA hydrolase ArfB [Planctomycetota bacterium]
MPEIRVTPEFVIRDHELRWTAVRSSGPGGQNVNKVNSKVCLRWQPFAGRGFTDAWRDRFLRRNRNRINQDGDFLLHCDLHRDQHRNLAEACSRLAKMLRETQHPPKARRETKPTLGSKRRRVASKRRRSETKRMRRSPGLDD